MSTNYVTSFDVTIASGASLSSAADLNGTLVSSIVFPSGWTSASATFECSTDGVTYAALRDTTGAFISVAVSGLSFVTIDPSYFVGAAYVKIRSGTQVSPVTQTGDRTITIAAREL